MTTLQDIITNGTKKELKAFFAFDNDDSIESIVFKFNIWARKYFLHYFCNIYDDVIEDAEFHKDIDIYNAQCYRGELVEFVDAAFRGAAKTSRTKLFVAFVIANDISHFRKYIKILAADKTNATQMVTDIYNMYMHEEVAELYPELFEKSSKKREETMGSFTTSTGIKVIADTVGTDQRGALQENARPDFIVFEDFENKKTLRSAAITRAIWDNMEEARTSLAKGGACIYNCNYLSELGNVHKIIIKKRDKKVVLITPIISKDGVLAWPQMYSHADVDDMRKNDDDFAGERLCEPSTAKDIMFNRMVLNDMPIRKPIADLSGFKVYKKFDPSHRYGGGHDVAGGVGLDSSTSVYIDFDTIPCQVVATYASNEILPEAFGYEIARETVEFGKCIEGIENNKYSECITIAKQQKVKLYKKEGKQISINKKPPTEYGWNTNSATKPKMIFALVKAVEDGLIELNDEDLINECKSYSRNDVMDKEEDPRLTTRHFDLLIACAIAWQMKDFATYPSIGRTRTTNRPRPKTGFGRV